MFCHSDINQIIANIVTEGEGLSRKKTIDVVEHVPAAVSQSCTPKLKGIKRKEPQKHSSKGKGKRILKEQASDSPQKVC